MAPVHRRCKAVEGVSLDQIKLLTCRFVGLNSCNSFALSWLGYMPVILVRR